MYNLNIPKALSPESRLSVLFVHSPFQMDQLTGNFFLFQSEGIYIAVFWNLLVCVATMEPNCSSITGAAVEMPFSFLYSLI